MHIFVIMPFSEEMERVYRDLIKTPLEREGYIVSRADDPLVNGVYHENIYDQIAQSFDQMFDIKSQNVIEYGTEAESPKELPSQLLRALDRAKRGDYVFSNIVSNFARTASRSIAMAPPARS